MADTVNLNNLTEHQDDSKSLSSKISQLAKLVMQSKHVMFFTGAGISTSANIPDFRGPNGVWTCQAQNRSTPAGVPITQATPTSCHMTIAEMISTRDNIKFVVSQNIDGLHRRSGISPNNISELHGNCYLEVCWACGKDYLRTYDVSDERSSPIECAECRQRVPHFCHCTRRECECGAVLKDSIIHFKENLPQAALESAFANAEKADLCIVLGSSLTVSPACLVPKEVTKHGKLVIVNLQTTPQDNLAHLRIWAKTDQVINELASILGISVPSFKGSRASKEETIRMQAEAQQQQQKPQQRGGGVGSVLYAPAPTADISHQDKEDKGGYVDPKRDCPHMTDMVNRELSIGRARSVLSSGCEAPDCGDASENWMCLQCGKVACSRYVKEHMLMHALDDGHLLSTSLRDLSTWCHGCNTYVVGDDSNRIRDLLYLAKFNEVPPAPAAR